MSDKKEEDDAATPVVIRERRDAQWMFEKWGRFVEERNRVKEGSDGQQ